MSAPAIGSMVFAFTAGPNTPGWSPCLVTANTGTGTYGVSSTYYVVTAVLFLTSGQGSSVPVQECTVNVYPDRATAAAQLTASPSAIPTVASVT